tara:strand:- start:1667 stop:1897 length:231 start_codon:yes stop_codon:yes gene_type:complete
MLAIIEDLMAAVSDLEIWNHTEEVIEAACRDGFTMNELMAVIAICKKHGLTFDLQSEGCGDFGDEGTCTTIDFKRV